MIPFSLSFITFKLGHEPQTNFSVSLRKGLLFPTLCVDHWQIKITMILILRLIMRGNIVCTDKKLKS